jgi:XTP/dITP diphosphohydrolase
MQRILIATRNAHKTREIRQILGAGFELSDLTSHPGIPPTIESGATFEENAKLKAVEASRHFDGLVLADDSGIEVDALGGAPGVYSARYAGENADDEKNRARLLEELRRVKARGRKRSARFRCVIALAQSGNCVAIFEGAVKGVIVNQPKGADGFGYDPIFVPEGYCQTFAQLPVEVKNQLSHRGRALEKMRRFLTG